jgi:hypothetical protein
VRIELQVDGTTASVVRDIPDDVAVARLLSEESCTAVVVERLGGWRYRYAKAAK